MIRVGVLLALLLVPSGVHAADLSHLAGLFAGKFDSKVQWDTEDSADLLERDRHPWTTVIHTPVAFPALGPHVFYVEEYRDGNPVKTVRQRLVTLEPGSDNNDVRMQQFGFKVAPAVRGKLRDRIEKIQALGSDDLTPMPGCDILWRVDADGHWAGAIAPKACVVPGTGRARYVQYSVTLTEALYQRVDRILYADTDALAAGFADELPTVHLRTSSPADELR